mgnify:CR=1 FL=1
MVAKIRADLAAAGYGRWADRFFASEGLAPRVRMALTYGETTFELAWREAGGTRFRLDTGFLAHVARASVRGELAEEAEEYAEEGMVQAMRDLPELRDAMSLVWRILLLWMAVLALFVIGGWVS